VAPSVTFILIVYKKTPFTNFPNIYILSCIQILNKLEFFCTNNIHTKMETIGIKCCVIALFLPACSKC